MPIDGAESRGGFRVNEGNRDVTRTEVRATKFLGPSATPTGIHLGGVNKIQIQELRKGLCHQFVGMTDDDHWGVGISFRQSDCIPPTFSEVVRKNEILDLVGIQF